MSPTPVGHCGVTTTCLIMRKINGFVYVEILASHVQERSYEDSVSHRQGTRNGFIQK